MRGRTRLSNGVSRSKRLALTRMHNMHTVTNQWTLNLILPRRRGICVSTACLLRTQKACMDPLAMHRIDPDAEGEERFVATGRGSAGHVLVVVYTLRGDSVRLISVRRATPAENRTYEI